MSTLIVFLPPPGTSQAEYSYVLTPDGYAVSRHAQAPAALLPPHSRSGGETVAVVPARMLSWQRVDLPRGSGNNPARLRAVLDGMLEERLLDDPQDLHFALEPGNRTAGLVWVAVCNRLWLRTALQALETAGRPVSRVVPEFAPPSDGPELPMPEVHVIGTPEDPMLVVLNHGAQTGVAVFPLSSSALALAGVAVHGGAASDDPPSLVAEPSVAALAEELLGRPAVLASASQRWVNAARTRWDLAQFDLASTSRTRAFKKAGTLGGELLRAPQWRAARWGVALLATANILGINAWAWQENQALAAKKARIGSTLQQTFPSVQVVVDAAVQMERELAALRQSTGTTSSRDLENMLAALAQTVPPGRSATRVDYANGEARLQGLSITPDDVSNLSSQMRGQGYAARSEGDVLVVRPEGTP